MVGSAVETIVWSSEAIRSTRMSAPKIGPILGAVGCSEEAARVPM